MSKENVKFWAEGTADEIGDLLGLVISDYVESTVDAVAEEIGSKASTITAAIEGKNAHGYSILKKTCEKYDLKLELLISKK